MAFITGGHMQSKLASKKEFWEDHIKKWELSKLTQKSYCEEANIKLTTFVFWKSHLKKPKTKKFLPVELKSLPMDTSIKIKLLTGNIICIPFNIGITEIAKLIRLLEAPHA